MREEKDRKNLHIDEDGTVIEHSHGPTHRQKRL